MTQLAAALVGSDTCYKLGGVVSDSLWGQVDLESSSWIAGIGGPGSNAGVYDTGPGGTAAGLTEPSVSSWTPCDVGRTC